MTPAHGRQKPLLTSDAVGRLARVSTAEIRWPREAGPLTLHLPTDAALRQVLTWRNDPDVTRWLMRTTVDPDAFRSDWLASIDDPAHFTTIAPARG